MPPDITFIVPLYNAQDTVREALESIISQISTLSFQILVINDGSTDSSLEQVQSWLSNRNLPPRISVEVHTQPNGGEAVAVNHGLRLAKAPLIAWVESDVKLDSNWLPELLSVLDEPGVVGAGGVLYPADGDSLLSTILGYEITYKIESNYEHPQHITSANALYKTSVFQELGPCAEHLGDSSFDSEYNQRIADRGWKLRLNKNAKAWHHFKSSAADCLRRTFWYGFRRPYIKSQVLYPADRWIGILVLLAAAILPLLIMAPWLPWLSLLGMGFILAAHFLYGVALYRRFGYTPLLASGFIFWIRNFVFFYAYTLGWMSLLYRRTRK